MPTTPDRPQDAGDELEATTAEHQDARETVAVSRDRPTEQLGLRPPRAARRDGAGRSDPGRSDPGRSDPGRSDPSRRETVKIDLDALGRHPTVKVPGQRRPADRAGRAPLVVAAGFATLWAALLSYLPVAAVIGLARTLEGAGGLGGAASAGLAGWLLGHGVPIGTAIGPLSLPPLLLTLLVTWRLNKAGLHVTRAIGARRGGSLRTALQVAGTVGLWYSVLGVLAATLVDGPHTEVSTTGAALRFFALGVFGALVGALRSSDALGLVASRMPRPLRHGLRTGIVAALLILAAGAICTGLSVAVGGGQAADMIAAYRTGVAGQAGITLISLAYGANAVIWAAAYLLGPGFALGTGSAIRLTEVTAGPLPTLPLLAGLPNGPIGAAGTALLAIPVLIGMTAGALNTRRLMRPRPATPGAPAPQADPSWSLVVTAALVAGPTTGVLLGALAALSSGSLGNGRLTDIGPPAWSVALIATAIITISAPIGAAAARAFRAH